MFSAFNYKRENVMLCLPINHLVGPSCKDIQSLQIGILSIAQVACRQFGLKYTFFLQLSTHSKLDISVVQVYVPSGCKGILWDFDQLVSTSLTIFVAGKIVFRGNLSGPLSNCNK